MSKATVNLESLRPGEKFSTEIGNFIVLEQNRRDSCFEGWTKVIQDDFFKKDVRFGNNTRYETSGLKNLFDGEITETYEKVFGDAIVEHEADIVTVDNQHCGTIKCKVRPITFDEARQYNKHIVKKELPDWWWTCSPWSTPDRGWKYNIAVVCPSGNVGNGFFDDFNGVRPICILKSNLFVSKVEE